MCGMSLFVLYMMCALSILCLGIKRKAFEIVSSIYLLSTLFCVSHTSWPFIVLIWLLVCSVLAIIHVPYVRTSISNFIYRIASHKLPTLSKTEEEALNSGDTWLERDIFRGQPDWKRLVQIKSVLSEEEQAFLDNETQTLCSMLNEWEMSQQHDLSDAVWAYLKQQGFLGLVIAKAYGGKGFSARAHSEIILKIASRSGAAAVTAMVPNSLGPGELLQHYGTEEQKQYYLPRLAKGLEIPCFALTEPAAGSDATSIRSEAIVMKKILNGQEQLVLKLTLNKRWITLAPVATLVGLAVNLKDPDDLLQGVGKPGITCLLIPANTKHLVLGNRHIPAHQPFMNGTIRGENVLVPISSIIGGQAMAGSGWRMLVDCLSIGRSISLPTLSTASSAIAYITSGAYARIRQQFHVEIAQFEGIEEKLAEIAGLQYLINATRLLTAAAVDDGQKPSVASAITKYFNTELARVVINHAMDIHAGRAVVVGPRNYLSNYYQTIPVAITVEGANIMTRNLLIFGQGSMACHPFLREEFYAIAQQDKQKFHQLLWQHIGYFTQNMAKAICSAWTGGILTSAPIGSMKQECRKLNRLSHAYATLADFSLICLGGELKRKERMSARLADGMSYLYLGMAALRYCQSQAEHPEEVLHAKWALAYCFHHAERAMLALCQNFPSRFLGRMMQWLIFPFGHRMSYPHDALSRRLAKEMSSHNHYRQMLCQSIYLSGDPAEPVDKMEYALQLLIKHGALYKKISDLKRYRFGDLAPKLVEKVEKNELTQEEADTILKLEKARWDAIQVDEFTCESMKQPTFDPVAVALEKW